MEMVHHGGNRAAQWDETRFWTAKIMSSIKTLGKTNLGSIFGRETPM